MAGYSTIINSKFEPISFERYLKPYQMYAEEYISQEDALSELANKASIWEDMANEQTDPYAYSVYKKYSEDLNNAAEQLASQGLSPISRQNMLKMKQRYSSDIIPIEQAYQRRQSLVDEQRKLSSQDNTMMFDIDASSLSLDDLIKNPQLTYTPYSGSTLIKQVSNAAKNLSKVMREDSSTWKSILGDQYYEKIMREGYSPEEILQVLSTSDKGSAVLRGLVEDAVNSSGIAKWNDPTALQRAYEYAGQGLWDAIGKTSFDRLSNKNFEYNQQLKLAREKASILGLGNTKSLSNIDRTSYAFPKVVQNIPNIVDEKGKLKGKNIDKLFNEEGKFTEPKEPNLGGGLSTENKFSPSNITYGRINSTLLDSGFTQEDINNMTKEDIENAISLIQQHNAMDLTGMDIYRFSLDDNATKHLISKIGGRGFEVQEFEGMLEGKPQYSKNKSLEYKDGASGDVLFDPSLNKFMLLYEGKYYKLPEGMISSDIQDELNVNLGKNPTTNTTRVSQIQNAIKFLESKEKLSLEEIQTLNSLYEEISYLDILFGNVGKEFTKYIGTKNINN